VCPGRIEEAGDDRKAGAESHKRDHTLDGLEIVELIFIVLQIPKRFAVGDRCDDVHGEELGEFREVDEVRIRFRPEILPLNQRNQRVHLGINVPL
jgi:hypothetical protein